MSAHLTTLVCERFEAPGYLLFKGCTKNLFYVSHFPGRHISEKMSKRRLDVRFKTAEWQCSTEVILDWGYQIKTTDPSRCRTGVTPPIRALKVWDMNQIRHSDQINPCRKIVPQFTEEESVMVAIWHFAEYSFDILASLVWHSVRAVYSQTPD